MKPKLIHGVVLFVVAFAALYYLKYTVEQKEIRLTEAKAQYLEDQKALKVLKAEWTMLNSPQYLQDLTRKYLNVRPLKHTQLASWAENIPGAHLPLTPISYASRYSLPAATEIAASTSIPKPGRGDEP